MTIHKSKGLAFNVVMIPFNWEGSKNFSELWVDSSIQTNKLLQNALIRTSRKLENSEFSKEYKKEQELRFLDNLNKLYVATTRPKERLYIFKKEYPKITDSFLSGKLNSLLYYYGVNNTLVMGDSSQKYSMKHKPTLEVFCAPLEKNRLEKKISLNKSSEKSWGY